MSGSARTCAKSPRLPRLVARPLAYLGCKDLKRRLFGRFLSRTPLGRNLAEQISVREAIKFQRRMKELMMQAQADYSYGADNANHDSDSEALDSAELREAFVSLRQQFQSVASDMREVLKENAKLNDEVARLKRRRRSKKPSAEVQRLKQECVEGLARLQELAARTRPQQTAPRYASHYRSGPSDSDVWMKKMMMVMMLSNMR